MKTNFETETCSRCNGSGKYSFCERYLDRCFKCAGSGVTYSKRGAAARAFYEQLCTIPASQVKIGDRVAASGVTRGGSVYNYVGSVVAISTEERITETTRELRADGSFNVSYKRGSVNAAGEVNYDSWGSTVEWKSEAKGEAGTTVEKYTLYKFDLTSKYGKGSESGAKGIRVYPADNSAQVAEALAYQSTLTKQGKPYKVKKAKE